jgi:hypothetical protein
MANLDDLIEALGEGKTNSKHARKLEKNLGMDTGPTQEQTRDFIRDAIINEEIPIGSTPQGFFLINTEDELIEVVKGLEGRINGLQKRIDALKSGWERRLKSRNSGGNWPK